MDLFLVIWSALTHKMLEALRSAMPDKALHVSILFLMHLQFIVRRVSKIRRMCIHLLTWIESEDQQRIFNQSKDNWTRKVSNYCEPLAWGWFIMQYDFGGSWLGHWVELLKYYAQINCQKCLRGAVEIIKGLRYLPYIQLTPVCSLYMISLNTNGNDPYTDLEVNPKHMWPQN